MGATFNDRVRAARKLLSGPAPELPGWLRDQAQAAEREAWGRLFTAAAGGVLAGPGAARFRALDGQRPEGVELHATLLAAALGCEPCSHVRKARGPLPVVVNLGLHRADCERCAVTVRHPPDDETDRCDVCGSRGNRLFRAFAVVFGHLVIAGDAGPCCDQRTGLS